jgi:hypothetical protein
MCAPTRSSVMCASKYMLLPKLVMFQLGHEDICLCFVYFVDEAARLATSNHAVCIALRVSVVYVGAQSMYGACSAGTPIVCLICAPVVARWTCVESVSLCKTCHARIVQENECKLHLHISPNGST